MMMGITLMEEFEMCPPVEGIMIVDILQFHTEGIGVALIMDVKLYQALDLSKGIGIGIALIMDVKHYQILHLSKGGRVALIMDVKSYQIPELSKGKGVALILDVKLYPILDLNKATTFIMEQQKAL